MKFYLVLVPLLLAPLKAEKVSADSYFKKGEAALAENDVATAKKYYTQALKINPKHGNSRHRLLSMRNLNAAAKLRIRKERFNEIKLPQITFEDMTLAESLEVLGALVEKATEDTFTPNFVIADPNDQLKDAKINLKLRNVPASTVLKYVLSQGKASAKWGEYTVTVAPLVNAKR